VGYSLLPGSTGRGTSITGVDGDEGCVGAEEEGGEEEEGKEAHGMSAAPGGGGGGKGGGEGMMLFSCLII